MGVYRGGGVLKAGQRLELCDHKPRSTAAPTAGRGRKRQEGPFPRASKGDVALLQRSQPGDTELRTASRNISVALSSRCVVACYGSPRKLTRDEMCSLK